MPGFNEDNTVGRMLIDVLKKNGWTYVPSENLPRNYTDVIVEPMLRNALIRINKITPLQADDVIYRLKKTISSVTANSLIAKNEEFKRIVFETNSYPFGENGRAVPISLFDTLNPSNNDYTVTEQWIYPSAENGKRFDLVLLINGIPVVVGEIKSPVRPSVSYLDAACDIAAYEKSVPSMFVSNVFNFASEGKCYRYGAVGMPGRMWGPWHTETHKAEGTLNDVRVSVSDMIMPDKVLDIMRFFTLYSTDKKRRKIKLICRYQQYDGANAIVERVLAGWPKKGLIWHFQGSGKSLLMVFAAQKLRSLPSLKNPTVVVVDDRIDLETHMTSTFNAADIPNLAIARSKEELITFFKADIRKILITTIFKFGEVDRVLNNRSNIIVMVDEAHRTQEGNLGAKMRTALPNAFFFGLTGTPVNKLDRNTFVTFGAEEDRSGYMSRYSFSDSVRDGATLPLHFQPVPADMHVDKELIDSEFSNLVSEYDLDDEKKAEISARITMKAIMYNPSRIRRVCEFAVKHFTEKIAPNGYKAQFVAYDRLCCLKYKAEFDRLLGEEASTVVIDTNNDKEGMFAAYRRSRDEETKVLDVFRDPDSKLKIIIVTSKLLTGFDAPILQVMYLDKPMRDHTLLQAICRTNRAYNEGKSYGLVVDFIGIFDDVARALRFDESAMKTIITNIEDVKKQIPRLMDKCLAYFSAINRQGEKWTVLADAEECLKDVNVRDAFAADYRVLNRVWDAISPDTFLEPYRTDYSWLSQVYQAVRPVDLTGRLIWAELGAKTMEIVDRGLAVDGLNESVETIVLDSDLVDNALSEQEYKRRARRLEFKLAAIIRKGRNNKKFIELGEKLEQLREKHAEGLITSIEFLKMLLELAKEAAKAEKEENPVYETDEERCMAALTRLFYSVRNVNTPTVVSNIVHDIDEVVRQIRYPGWQSTIKGPKDIKKRLRGIIFVKYGIRDEDVIRRAYGYVEQYY